MTVLLLDSHALLWAFTSPRSLSAAAASAVRDQANEVSVSSVSGYELAYKNKLGKLPQADLLLANIATELANRRLGRLDLTLEQALLAGRLRWSHRDPFDRLLVAQALTNDLTLVSNEALFDATGIRRLW